MKTTMGKKQAFKILEESLEAGFDAKVTFKEPVYTVSVELGGQWVPIVPTEAVKISEPVPLDLSDTYSKPFAPFGDENAKPLPGTGPASLAMVAPYGKEQVEVPQLAVKLGAIDTKGYSIVWSCRKGKPRAITFVAKGMTTTYEEESMGELNSLTLMRYELDFCKEWELTFADLTDCLSWKGWNNTPFFSYKLKSSIKPAPFAPRMCTMGCGRVLRDHDQYCTQCQEGQSLYDLAILGIVL